MHKVDVSWIRSFEIQQARLLVLGENIETMGIIVVLGGLGVTCSPRDPMFAGSNPAEVDEFFQDVKILSICPTGGTLSRGS